MAHRRAGRVRIDGSHPPILGGRPRRTAIVLAWPVAIAGQAAPPRLGPGRIITANEPRAAGDGHGRDIDRANPAAGDRRVLVAASRLRIEGAKESSQTHAQGRPAGRPPECGQQAIPLMMADPDRMPAIGAGVDRRRRLHRGASAPAPPAES